MKTKVTQSVVSNSVRFLNNIEKTLPSGVQSFHISSFGMKRASGCGSYNYVMEVSINDEYHTLKMFTHDSLDFDYYTDLDYMSHNFNNWTKRRIINMIENNRINDEIYEIANSNE